MFCPQCGAENENFSRFCRACGADLSATSLYAGARASDGDTTSVLAGGSGAGDQGATSVLAGGSGARDQGATSVLPKGSDRPRGGGTLSFCDGLYEALNARGLSLLNDPRTLLALAYDLCDNGTLEFRLFEHNCDLELLECFAGMAGGRGSEQQLDEAQNRAYLLLCDRSLEADSARAMCRSMRDAIARCMGFAERGPADADAAVAAEAPVPQAIPASYASTTDARRRWDDVDAMPQGSQGQAVAGVAPNLGAQGPQGQVAAGVTQNLGAQGYAGAQGYGSPQGAWDSQSVPPTVPPYAEPQPPQKGRSNTLLIVLIVVLILAIGGVSYLLINQSNTSDSESQEQTVTATISYSGGSNATGTMKSTTVEQGEQVTLRSCDFKRSGYEFEYWEDEDGKRHNPGDTVTADQDMELKAHWKKKSSNVSTPSNDTSGSANSTSPSTTTSTTAPSNSRPSDSTMAAKFTTYWEGTYDGSDGDGNVFRRQLIFEFNTVTSTGDLTGICYIGVADVVPGATYGSFNVKGTANWDTGAVHIWFTSWIDQGGLSVKKEFQGTMDISSGTMSGFTGTLDSGDLDMPWWASITSGASWNKNVPTFDEPEPTHSKADSFPTRWSGTYEGWTSHQSGDDTISRALTFDFTTVTDNGYLEGVCYVGVDDDEAGATNASYSVTGHVDWDSGSIHVEGTSWINRGGLDDMRQFDGTVDFDGKSISGRSSDVGTGDYEGGFWVSA